MGNKEKEAAQQLTDAAIIDLVLAGEHSLYELLIRRYNARLFRAGMSIVNNDAGVEELMQITYMKTGRFLVHGLRG